MSEVQTDDASGRRSCSAQVLVDDVGDPSGPLLDDAAVHHLGRVLRLRAGELVCAADGQGGWRLTRFVGENRLQPAGGVHREDRSALPVTVAFVPVKRDRAELVVQKLTEIGVDRIVVTTSERAVVRWDGDRADRHIERLRRVADEAVQQCRRLFVPTVEVTPLADLLAAGAALADIGAAAEPALTAPVVIGPEGGWTDRERSMATVPPVDLGEHVLRAETAAIVAGVLLTRNRGWAGRDLRSGSTEGIDGRAPRQSR